MMRIPESVIQDVIHRADIVDIARSFHLELKKAGDSTFKACCPFHNEKTPSFHLNSSKQLYHCFGCGEGGGVIKFVQKMVNTDFLGAMRWLADRYHISLPEFSEGDVQENMARRKRMDDGMRLLDETAGFFQSNLSGPLGQQAREYLASRGIDEETIQRYRLGYAPDSWDATVNWALGRGYSGELLKETGVATFKEERPDRLYDRWRNRIMFPICDELSRVVAFSGRVFDPKDADHGGKYVNSPESDFFHKSRVLYGFNIARQSFKQVGWALVCEGQLDVIACHRAGLLQAFASQGTAFTKDHARMIARSGVPSVHLAFDGDNAGFKATMKTLRLLLEANLQVEITTIPQGEDPDSIFRRGGGEALRAVMSAAEPALPYAFRVFCSQHPINTPEGKSAVVYAMLDLYTAIPDEVTAYGHCQELAKQLELPDRIVTDQYAKRKREEAEAEQRAQEYQRSGQQFVPQVQPQAPAMLFHDFHGVCALAATMLDLCVHFEPIAYSWKDLDVGEVMPAETPVVRALNMVLAGVAEDDWQGTIDALSQGELAEDATVAKVFMMSPFAEMVIDEDGTLPEKLEQAVYDCQSRLEKLKLDFQQQRLAEQLNDSTFADGDDLLRKSLEIAKKKNAMRKK